MNEVIIRISDGDNNVLGDLDLSTFTDFPLVITKGIVNLDNLKTRTGTYTKAFKVPNTKNNSVLLSNVDDINSRKDFRDALGRKPCSIMVNGNEIERGFVQVSKSYNGFDVDSFELVFFGNNIDWVKGASELKLNTLDFANNAQIYNTDDIKDANFKTFNTGYDHCYPYISRGGNEKPNDTEVRDYYPCFYLSALLTRGLNELGWNINSSFLNDSDIQKLACDLNGDMTVSQTTVDNSKTRASKTSDSSLRKEDFKTYYQDDSSTPNNDLNDNFNTVTSGYTAPTDGRYVIDNDFILINNNYNDINVDYKSFLNLIIYVNDTERVRKTPVYYNPRTPQTNVKTNTDLRLKAGDIVNFYNSCNSEGSGYGGDLEVDTDIKTGSYFEIQRSNEALQQRLNSPAEAILDKVESLIAENKKLKKSGSTKVTETEIAYSESCEINDWVLSIEQISIEDNKLLRGMVDAKKKTIGKGSIILLNVQANKIAVVCGVTDNIIDQISAKDIVSNICEQINGRGGGRPDFAQGAGETENIKEFVTSIPNSVKSLASS